MDLGVLPTSAEVAELCGADLDRALVELESARRKLEAVYVAVLDRADTTSRFRDDGHASVGQRSLDLRSQCGYAENMNVATSRSEVGIRELKNDLSKFIDRVRAGEEVIVTDRGRPVARLSSLDRSADHLADLVAAGLVRPPAGPHRYLPRRKVKASGSVSDLVAEQRR